MKLASVVVGLGRIGQGYDEDDRDGSRLLTHANGFHHHPAFDLVGGVDLDPTARRRFEEKFKKPAFETVPELYASVAEKPAVVSIGVPTNHHLATFREVISRSPRAILCEKPIAAEVDDAQTMIKEATQVSCTLLVNYFRRFEPGARELGRRLADGELGDIYRGTLFYSKGLLNNASHLIDLLRDWLGEVDEIALVDPGRANTPLRGDPEPDFRLRIGGTVIYGIAVREECFSFAEIELIGTHGAVRYADGGNHISYRVARADPMFDGYVTLESTRNVVVTDLGRYQKYVLDGLSEALTSGRDPRSSGRTALGTLSVVTALLRQMTPNEK